MYGLTARKARTFLGAAELLYNWVCPYVRNSGEISFEGIDLLLEWSDLYNFREYFIHDYLPDEKFDLQDQIWPQRLKRNL